MEKTTIQISSQTLERIKLFKQHTRQSYDEVINVLCNQQEDETLSSEEIAEIKQGLDDIKKGKVYSIEHVAKELGVQLT